MHDDLAKSPTDSPNGQFDCATARVVEPDPSIAPEVHHSTQSATPTRRSGCSTAAAVVGLAGGYVPLADTFSQFGDTAYTVQ